MVATPALTQAVAMSVTAKPVTAKPVHHPNALWHLIHDHCAVAAAQGDYPPAPCVEVDSANGTARGYAVLKDRVGRSQYLVLPLARITGIESPLLLRADAPNYLADAWTARRYVEAARHQSLSREQLSLVVNSYYGRTQNQLHVHVDCIRPDVHDALQRLLPAIGEHWQPLSEPLPPHGRAYTARWVSGDTLALNPFQSLAASLAAGDSMAEHSLAVVGASNASGEAGFILLSNRRQRGRHDHGNSDDLQDKSCAIAGRAPHRG